MIGWLYFYVFYSGACLASFLYAAALRKPQKESLLTFSRSRCCHCRTKLSARNLFPLFSYLLQRGKCSYCGITFSSAYFWNEIIGGLLAVFLFFHYRNDVVLLVLYGFLYFVLFFLALMDSLYFLLPDQLQFFLLLLFVFIHLQAPAFPWQSAGNGLVGIILLGWISLLLVPHGIGGGDLKLMAIFGFGTGLLKTAVILLLASLSGILFFCWNCLFHKKNWNTAVPFGPFLIFAFYLVMESSFLFSFFSSLFISIKSIKK